MPRTSGAHTVDASKKTSKRKKPMAARACAYLLDHPALITAGTALLVFAAAASILWMTVFSGLSSSTEFIYSKF